MSSVTYNPGEYDEAEYYVNVFDDDIKLINPNCCLKDQLHNCDDDLDVEKESSYYALCNKTLYGIPIAMIREKDRKLIICADVNDKEGICICFMQDGDDKIYVNLDHVFICDKDECDGINDWDRKKFPRKSVLKCIVDEDRTETTEISSEKKDASEPIPPPAPVADIPKDEEKVENPLITVTTTDDKHDETPSTTEEVNPLTTISSEPPKEPAEPVVKPPPTSAEFIPKKNPSAVPPSPETAPEPVPSAPVKTTKKDKVPKGRKSSKTPSTPPAKYYYKLSDDRYIESTLDNDALFSLRLSIKVFTASKNNHVISPVGYSHKGEKTPIRTDIEFDSVVLHKDNYYVHIKDTDNFVNILEHHDALNSDNKKPLETDVLTTGITSNKYYDFGNYKLIGYNAIDSEENRKLILTKPSYKIKVTNGGEKPPSYPAVDEVIDAKDLPTGVTTVTEITNDEWEAHIDIIKPRKTDKIIKHTDDAPKEASAIVPTTNPLSVLPPPTEIIPEPSESVPETIIRSETEKVNPLDDIGKKVIIDTTKTEEKHDAPDHIDATFDHIDIMPEETHIEPETTTEIHLDDHTEEIHTDSTANPLAEIIKPEEHHEKEYIPIFELPTPEESILDDSTPSTIEDLLRATQHLIFIKLSHLSPSHLTFEKFPPHALVYDLDFSADYPIILNYLSQNDISSDLLHLLTHRYNTPYSNYNPSFFFPTLPYP